MWGAEPVCADDWLVLRVMDADGAWRGGLRVEGRQTGGKNGKIHGKVMNAARQISRRIGRSAGARTRSAADYSIIATLSAVPDLLDT